MFDVIFQKGKYKEASKDYESAIFLYEEAHKLE